MSRLPSFPILAIALLGAGLAACTHTPPGTSVEIALAKRAEMVRLPQAAVAAVPKSAEAGSAPAAVESSRTEMVADAFSRGQFCMQTGNDQEAILAFQEAVKLDPSFREAWNNLAVLYEKGGESQRALDAFKKSKL